MHAGNLILSLSLILTSRWALAADEKSDPCPTALATRMVTVAGLKITEAERDATMARSSTVAQQLIEFIKTPKDRKPSVDIDLNFSMNKHARERAFKFLNENGLLDRKLTTHERNDTQVAERIRGDMNDLVMHLDKLKGLTSRKVKVLRGLQKIPGSRLVIGDDPLAKYMTIKQKVVAIGDSLEAGIELMQQNNHQLRNLHRLTINEAQLMIQEIVYVQMLKDALKEHLDNDPDLASDPDLRRQFKNEVLARLERYSVNQKTLEAVMVSATEAINQQIEVNHIVVESAQELQMVAQPAIAITASVTLVAEDADREMAKHAAVRKLASDAVTQMTKSVKSNGEKISRLRSQPIIATETLLANMNELKQAKIDQDRRMDEAYKQLEIDNRKLDEVMREAQRLLADQQVGQNMHKLLSDDTNSSTRLH